MFKPEAAIIKRARQTLDHYLRSVRLFGESSHPLVTKEITPSEVLFHVYEGDLLITFYHDKGNTYRYKTCVPVVNPARALARREAVDLLRRLTHAGWHTQMEHKHGKLIAHQIVEEMRQLIQTLDD